jgi:hypothetical protein
LGRDPPNPPFLRGGLKPTPPLLKGAFPLTPPLLWGAGGDLPGFAFRPGRVTLILDRPLEDGYQIGSNNDVEKGMSGGPLLNLRGEVVGINGIHAYPLWDATELYADGSEPCPPLQDFIARSSWAIPIEVLSTVVAKTADNSFPLLLEDLAFPAIDQSQHRYTPYFILQMQLAAEAAKNCVPLGRNACAPNPRKKRPYLSQFDSWFLGYAWEPRSRGSASCQRSGGWSLWRGIPRLEPGNEFQRRVL